MSKNPDFNKRVASPPAPPRRLGVVSKLIADKANHLDQSESRNSEALIVSIEKIRPNPKQPRKVFDEERDQELADNIRENGVLEPLIVRETVEGQYEIVAGERRYRAAKLIGKTTVPVIVKDYDDQQAQFIAVVENLQRVDLAPLDEANYFKFLCDNYNYSYRDIGAMIHRSPSYVNDRMKLLNPSLSAEDEGEKNHKRSENNQKLQKSQLDVAKATERNLTGGRTLSSFDGWLDKTRRNLTQLKPTEQAELRDKLALLRSKIEALEKELPRDK